MKQIYTASWSSPATLHQFPHLYQPQTHPVLLLLLLTMVTHLSSDRVTARILIAK